MVVLATSNFFVRQQVKAHKQRKANESKSGASLIRYTSKNRREVYDTLNKKQIVKSMKNIDVGQPHPYYKKKGLKK